MSFCPICGNEVAPDAQFCEKCGTPVSAADPSVSMPITQIEGAPSAVSFEAPLTPPSVATPPSADAPAQPAQPAAPRRRKLPVAAIVAIVLGVAVVAGVGIGVAYTQFAAQSAPVQAVSDGVKESYQAVVDDYSTAISDYAASGSSYSLPAFSAKHQLIYEDRESDKTYLDQSKCKLVYTYVYLGNQNIPAMLVKATPVGTDAESGASDGEIVAAYTLVDGKPKLVVESQPEKSTVTLVDDKYLCMSSSGKTEAGEAVNTKLYFDLSPEGTDDCKQDDGSGTTYVNGFSISASSPSNIHAIGSVCTPAGGNGDATSTIVHPDGSVTETQDQASDASSSLEAECTKQFGKASKIEWSEPEASENSTNKTAAEIEEEAKAAYQVVIDDYNAAAADYAQQGKSYDQKQFTASHPYIYTDRVIDSYALDSSKGKLYYAFAAYAGNDTPVMLIKKVTENAGNGSTTDVIAAYTLEDGKPSLIDSSVHEGSSFVLIENRCLCLIRSGTDKAGNMVNFTLYFEVGAQGSATYEKAEKGGDDFWYVNDVSISLPNPSCIKPLGSISRSFARSGGSTIVHPNGTTETVSNTGNSNAAKDALEAECLEACQETLDIKWQPMS